MLSIGGEGAQYGVSIDVCLSGGCRTASGEKEILLNLFSFSFLSLPFSLPLLSSPPLPSLSQSPIPGFS